MSNNVCYTTRFNPDGSERTSQSTFKLANGDTRPGGSPSFLAAIRSHLISERSTVILNPTPKKHTTLGGHLNASHNAHSILLSGSIPDFIRSDEVSYRQKKNNPRFEKSKRNGEIVVSPYQRHRAQISYNPVAVIKDKGPCPATSTNHYGNNGEKWFPRRTTNPFKGYYPWEGGYANATQYLIRRHGELTHWVHPLDDVNREELKSKFKMIFPVLEDPDFVQSTFADANARSMDFLTTVFELPETIMSMGEVLLTIRKSINSYIARSNLTKQERKNYLKKHKALVDNARIQFQKYNKLALSIQSDPKKLAKYTRSAKYWERKMKSLRKERTLTLASFATTLSNLWLRLRYEVLPNIYSVEDLAETAETQWNVFQTERNRLITDYWTPEVPGYEFSGTSELNWRVMVKYGYGQSIKNDFRKACSTNAFLTAWELGKLTFVLDWFFSVGNFLGAKFGKPSLAVTEGHTLSSKLVIKGTYTNTTNGASFDVDYEGYVRRVITSQEFSGIFFRINLNWMRYADAGALLFGKLKQHFKTK